MGHNVNTRPGIIDPARCYTRTEVLRLGFGVPQLAEARRSGIVRGRRLGRNVWFLGADLIRYIQTQPIKPVSPAADEGADSAATVDSNMTSRSIGSAGMEGDGAPVLLHDR